jgi:collagen type VII alpha
LPVERLPKIPKLAHLHGLSHDAHDAREASMGSDMNNTNSPLTYLPISRRTIGAVGLTAALLLGVPAGALASNPKSVTEAFSSTGEQQSFTVPVGVSSVRVQAIGAAGEEGIFDESPGGSGGDVVGQLPVTAGEVLYVEVGSHGFNGGAPSFGPGGGFGGDASDVRTISREAPNTLESRLLVAAGGGGAGGNSPDEEEGGSGGRGGDAGSAGATGTSGNLEEEDGSESSPGGGAGTLTGGGTTAFDDCGEPGEEGTLGNGGPGGEGFGEFSSGGGGGGGYYGGGGGDGSCDEGGPEGGAGGGGGGGSSFVSEAATFASFGLASSSTAPSVSITYATPATATSNKDAITFPATQPLETVSPPQTLTITNEGGNPLVINSEMFTGSEPAVSTDKPEDFLISSSSCLGPIGYEESCTLTVRFTPEAEGLQTATLKIAGNAGAGATSVTLTGTGGTLPQGPTGATGPEGKEGKEGPTGTTGSQGPTGATGSTGAIGSQGAAGATGSQGATGATGSQGSTGEAGPKGEAGSKGETGATGTQGTTGETGKTGEIGKTGATGPKGSKGSKGAKGDRGAQGPQGLTALYVCHKRELSGKYEKACFVQVLSASTSAVKATLSRNGVIYARGKGGGTSGQTLELGASKPVPNGHYKLTLISKSLATTTQTITVG